MGKKRFNSIVILLLLGRGWEHCQRGECLFIYFSLKRRILSSALLNKQDLGCRTSKSHRTLLFKPLTACPRVQISTY